MARFINPLFVNSSIDANIVDHVAAGTWEPIRRILELQRANKIQLIIPHSVRTELLRPTTPAGVRAAAQDLIFTIPVGLTVGERKERDRLLQLSRGNANLKNIAADLMHVAEAGKYGGYFITLDERLLKRSAVISDVIGVEVVTPERFIERVAEAQEGLDQEENMNRAVISKEELQTWLTTEIRKFEGCEKCSFGGIIPLRQKDENAYCLSSENVMLEVFKQA
jgi:hypothetical protein